MSRLTNLPGVAGGEITDCVFAHSIAAFMRKLGEHRAAMAASDNGAITVYEDDAGKYRCDFCRYSIVQAEATCESKTAVKRFLKEHFQKIY